MYPLLGDKDAQDELRLQTPNLSHCPWLRRDPNACESMPEDVDGVTPGSVCPHHVYVHKASVFETREGVADTVDRLFRQLGAAELGMVVESELDSLTATEIITAKSEIEKIKNEKTQQQMEKNKPQPDGKPLPSWGIGKT